MKTPSWMKKAAKSITKVTDDAVKTISDTGQHAVDTVVDTAVSTEKTVEHTVIDTVNTVENTAKSVADSINHIVLQPTQQALSEALNQAAKNANIASDEFNYGTKIAGKYAQEGVNKVEQGLVEVGEYLESNICNIALSAALSGAFVGMLDNPTPETQAETTVLFAPLCAETAIIMTEKAVEYATLKSECSTIAASLVEVVCFIPDVKKGVGNHKDDLIAAVSYCIFTALNESPYAFLSPQTACCCVAGIVSFVVSDLVCDGTLPAVG